MKLKFLLYAAGATVALYLPYSGQAQHIQHELVRALTEENISLLMDHYADDAVLMPEYHQALYNKNEIRHYYEARFMASNTSGHTRIPYSTEELGDYRIETGTFAYTFQLTGKAPFAYRGKYIIVWRTDQHTNPKIISEIWGSVDYIERSILSFSTIKNTHYRLAPEPVVETPEAKQIHDRNAFISRCVKTRDGATLADTYSNDAIYMPYYSPMLIGKEKITAYYLEHENPAVTIDSVQIKASRILISGAYAIVDGRYGVKWRSGNDSGLVTGKSINIWKRKEDGVFMLYRQMSNHD